MQNKKTDKKPDKNINVKDLFKKGMPSALCSGCWDPDELEEYLKQSKIKKTLDIKNH